MWYLERIQENNGEHYNFRFHIYLSILSQEIRQEVPKIQAS